MLLSKEIEDQTQGTARRQGSPRRPSPGSVVSSAHRHHLVVQLLGGRVAATLETTRPENRLV
jgi:hypothetical protein